MSFSLRPAVRENVGLLIGLAGGTGSGKSLSAMRIAKGLAGDSPFAVIDTENGRALFYADRFKFDHGELQPPFKPDSYSAAIKSIDELKKYPVIIVDSASHEYGGEGGLLDWHEDELSRMAGDDWKKREACAMSAWVKPKMAHKQFVNKLLQVRAHIILCFRAESKVEMVKKEGKWVIQPKQTLTGLDGWVPICEKNLPYELTASFLLTADAPGVPKPIKLMDQHRAFFPLDKPISEECGMNLREWSMGGMMKPAAEQTTVAPNQPAAWLKFKYVEKLPTKYQAHADQLFKDALRLEGFDSADSIPSDKFKEVAKRIINQAATIAAI